MLDSQRITQRIIIAATVSIALGAVTWYVAGLFNTPLTLQVGGLGVGAVCPLTAYDSTGQRRPFAFHTTIEYVGKAPVYFADQSLSTGQDESGCHIFPDKISPDIAKRGLPMYPLRIHFGLSRNKISPYDDATLYANASVQEYFTADKDFRLLLLDSKKEYKVHFELHSDTVSFSPSNESNRTSILSLTRDVENEWVIHPLENMAGRHYIIPLLINEENNQRLVEINKELRIYI